MIYNLLLPKTYYTERGYIEVEVGTASDRKQYLPWNKQANRKQYGLKYHFTSTNYTATGDTLYIIAMKVSLNNSNSRILDKEQIIVILSRTKRDVDTIVVSNKNDTLKALKFFLIRKMQ